ncbi:MAG: DMT family transporter [Candidatus Nanohaloarchaea archaeon]|nr:DMT family transporter [Candidatus Nanohaloarchaea archaeon]
MNKDMVPGLWFFLGLGAALSFSFMALTINKGLETLTPPQVLFYLFVFGTLFYGLAVLKKEDTGSPTKKDTLILVGGAFCLFLGNLLVVTGYTTAPNIGYVDTVKASRVLFVTAAATLFFRSRINLKSGLGIVLVFGGIVVLSLV